MLAPLRQQYQERQTEAEQDRLSSALVTVLHLAIDGLWFADLFALAPPEGALRAEVMQLLLDLTHLRVEDIDKEVNA